MHGSPNGDLQRGGLREADSWVVRWIGRRIADRYGLSES